MTLAKRIQSASKRIALVTVAAVGLSACQGAGGNEVAGTIFGAALGGFIGSEIGGHGSGAAAGAALGTFAGAAIGNSIGRSLDERDRVAQAQAREYALESTPSGESSDWYNPDTGHEGSFTPQPAYQNSEGQYCREYQQTVTIAGRTEEAYGTACRQPDGSWKIISG